jgi:hypothetical protein
LIILRGVEKNKARILVGKDAKLLTLISRLVPVNYPKILSMIGSDFADVNKKT